MISVSNILTALKDFLNEVQTLGLIKEFMLIECEQKNEEALLKAEQLLPNFLNKIGCKCKYMKHDGSTLTKDSEVGKEKKSEENIIDPVEKDLVQMQVDTNEVSTESYSSPVTEQEKKSSVSYSLEKENEVQMQDDINEESLKTEEDVSVEPPVNKNLVQIQVDSSEMKRRISAFITRKRKEVDEWNVQEFCGRSYVDEQDPAWEKLDSCARVDAIFVPRRGCKSHIKVSKVKNLCGPQTQPQPEAKKIKQEPSETENQTNDDSLQAITERLLNMETHLKLKSDSSLRFTIFQRLKDLENRIMLLESTSPEYIHHLPSSDYLSPKKNHSEKEKTYSNYSTDELQKKIQNLKESLKMKSPNIKSEPLF